jgi:hypothetical protein
MDRNWHVLAVICDFSIDLCRWNMSGCNSKTGSTPCRKSGIECDAHLHYSREFPIGKSRPSSRGSSLPLWLTGSNWDVIEQVWKSRIFQKAMKLMRECSRRNLRFVRRPGFEQFRRLSLFRLQRTHRFSSPSRYCTHVCVRILEYPYQLTYMFRM